MENLLCFAQKASAQDRQTGMSVLRSGRQGANTNIVAAVANRKNTEKFTEFSIDTQNDAA